VRHGLIEPNQRRKASRGGVRLAMNGVRLAMKREGIDPEGSTSPKHR
jgi:hypothetical protein